MKLYHPEAKRVAQKYIGWDADLEILGWGVDGAVFIHPERQAAVKVFLHDDGFQREYASYRRLSDCGCVEVLGFHVPQLSGVDVDRKVIEMSIVKRPFLLDFAGSLLTPPDFSEDVMADWWLRVEERFGDRFPVVQNLYNELVDRFGIYYLDAKPGNIEFAD